jgi:hypothetical protein
MELVWWWEERPELKVYAMNQKIRKESRPA